MTTNESDYDASCELMLWLRSMSEVHSVALAVDLSYLLILVDVSMHGWDRKKLCDGRVTNNNVMIIRFCFRLP